MSELHVLDGKVMGGVPLAESSFGAWQNINNFNLNNDTWTAPDDGFLQLSFTAVATDVYVYAYSAGVNRAAISNKGVTGGYAATAMTPVHKGEQFVLLTNQSSGVTTRFMPIKG